MDNISRPSYNTRSKRKNTERYNQKPSDEIRKKRQKTALERICDEYDNKKAATDRKTEIDAYFQNCLCKFYRVSSDCLAVKEGMKMFNEKHYADFSAFLKDPQNHSIEAKAVENKANTIARTIHVTINENIIVDFQKRLSEAYGTNLDSPIVQECMGLFHWESKYLHRFNAFRENYQCRSPEDVKTEAQEIVEEIKNKRDRRFKDHKRTLEHELYEYKYNIGIFDKIFDKLQTRMKNSTFYSLKDLYTTHYDQGQKDLQKDEITISDLSKRSEALNKILEPIKLLIAAEIQEKYKDLKDLHDTTAAYWKSHQTRIKEKATQEQITSFTNLLEETSRKIEGDQRLKVLARRSGDLEQGLNELKLLIEKTVPYFVTEDYSDEVKRSLAEKFPNSSIEYANSESVYTAAVTYVNKRRETMEGKLTLEQVNALKILMEEVQDLDVAQKKLCDLDSFEIAFKNETSLVIEDAKSKLEQTLATAFDTLLVFHIIRLQRKIGTEDSAFYCIHDLYLTLYCRYKEYLKQDDITAKELARRSEALRKALEATKLMIAAQIHEKYKDLKDTYDKINNYWVMHQTRIQEKITQKQFNSFTNILKETSSKIENDLRLKDLAQRSQALEQGLNELKQLIIQKIPIFIQSDINKNIIESEAPKGVSIVYKGSDEDIYNAAVAYSNNKIMIKEKLTKKQADDLSGLMEEVQDLKAAQEKLIDLHTLQEKLRDIEYLDKIKPVKIEQFIHERSEDGTLYIHHDGTGKAMHVFWAIDTDNNLFLAPKNVQGPSQKQLEIFDTIMPQGPSVRAEGEAIIVLSTIPARHNLTESCLIDITSKNSSDTADDSRLEIGKAAFRDKMPLLEDVLQSLKKQDTSAEQTLPAFSAGSEQLLLASEETKNQLKKLKGLLSDSQLEDITLSDYSDADGNYTNGEEARVMMMVDLAADLSSTTKDIKDQFQMVLVPYRGDTVKYEDGWNRLFVPVDAPPLKTVLSIISEMDRAKYEWATSPDASQGEKYAQAAATAIRQIEVCRKLGEPMPQDLSSLATEYDEYNKAYTQAEMEKSARPKDVARRRIYDIYAQEQGFDSLRLPEVDARSYEVYKLQDHEGVEQGPSIEEMKWKIFKNTGYLRVPQEVEMDRQRGESPVKLGDPGFDERISNGIVTWVLSMGGSIIVSSVKSTHGATAGGRPILVAGETNIVKHKGYNGDHDEYELCSINLRSGHFSPRQLMYAIGLLHRQGIRIRFLSRQSLD